MGKEIHFSKHKKSELLFHKTDIYGGVGGRKIKLYCFHISYFKRLFKGMNRNIWKKETTVSVSQLKQ